MARSRRGGRALQTAFARRGCSDLGNARLSKGERPAFYALGAAGWREYVTLLHLPYTLWHLSYVTIGACLATRFSTERLGLLLAAFGLALGIGAHALDELNGRPLRTSIAPVLLVSAAAVSIAGAAAIGVTAAALYTWWLLAFVAAGVILVVSYNVELFGGRIHTDLWFALAWGGFPVLTAFFTMEERLRLEAFLAAGFAVFLSLAQRSLSTAARDLRRRTRAIEGSIEWDDGRREPLTREGLLSAPEAALRTLTLAVVSLAAAFLVLRLR